MRIHNGFFNSDRYNPDLMHYIALLHMERFCDIGSGRGWVRNVNHLIGGMYAGSSTNV